MTTATSIDSAANAYVRHRFVRAFGASYMVLIAFALVSAILVGCGIILLSGTLMQIALMPLGVLVGLFVGVLPTFLFLTLTGALGDVLHRRVTGALLVGFALYILFFTIAGVLNAILMLFGADIGLPGNEGFWLGVLGVIGSAIGYEILRHGWWQLTTSRENFFAVRGWRTSSRALLMTLRRQLGLPAFLSYVGKNRMAASFLYLAVALLNVGLIVILVLPTFIGSFSEFDNPLALGAVLAVMIALLVANIFGAGNLVARRADARATALYQSVREWDTRAPIVFLRSFNQDDDRVPVTGGDAFARWPAGISRSRTLDELLLEHGSPYGPVLAIGDPRDPVPPLGAARVFVPERGNGWQDVVRGLVDASKCVVMCPNTGKGVQWELDLIAASSARLNVIFLASPELTRADTLALFQRLVPDMCAIAEDQTPIAAYAGQGGEWRVLTAKTLSLNAYTGALNASLQALFGLAGVALAAGPNELAPATQLRVVRNKSRATA
ncbi:MAG: hypothetical protein ABL871_05550 [Terricaulis sp.]